LVRLGFYLLFSFEDNTKNQINKGMSFLWVKMVLEKEEIEQNLIFWRKEFVNFSWEKLLSNSCLFNFIYNLSPQIRQSIQHTLYERLLVYINFSLITRDVRYRQESYIIDRFYFENKWYFMNPYNCYVSRFFLSSRWLPLTNSLN